METKQADKLLDQIIEAVDDESQSNGVKANFIWRRAKETGRQDKLEDFLGWFDTY